MVHGLSFALIVVCFSAFSDAASAQTACPIVLGGRGELPSSPVFVIGGSRSMEADYVTFIQPFLVNKTPETIEAIEFAGLSAQAIPTKETHRFSFQISVLPDGFGGNMLGQDTAVALQVRSERTGAIKLGLAMVRAEADAQGNPVSAINAFAQRYLNIKPTGMLAFVELGTHFSEIPRDPASVYVHVVERVGHLTGAGSICDDTFGVTADLAVRVYTFPRPATQ